MVVGVVHRGNYTCRAVNRLPQDEAVIGTVESCAQLFVISKSVTPTVYSMGEGGGSACRHCHAQPCSLISWPWFIQLHKGKNRGPAISNCIIIIITTCPPPYTHAPPPTHMHPLPYPSPSQLRQRSRYPWSPPSHSPSSWALLRSCPARSLTTRGGALLCVDQGRSHSGGTCVRVWSSQSLFPCHDID